MARVLATGLLYAAAGAFEIGDDAVAVIALYFDDAIFCGTTGAAMAAEFFADGFDLVRGQAVNQRHGACAAAFSCDADHTVVG